jgi:hypothetical protein
MREAQEKFGFLLDALQVRRAAPRWPGLRSRPPGHADGGATSIRDVIAFPKTQTAACVMTEAPGTVSAAQLRELHIRLREQEAKEQQGGEAEYAAARRDAGVRRRIRMAGHSKWANIKHRKAAQDAKRGKMFTKLIRELVVAAKQGGPLPEDNPRLRAAVDKALGANMTRDTIDRAIARGAGTNDADDVEELTYEGYAPGGVAVLVEAMTNNRNRTVAEVRHAFSKRGGNLGTDGSVAYLFSRKGQLSFPRAPTRSRSWKSPWRPAPRTWRPPTTAPSR